VAGILKRLLYWADFRLVSPVREFVRYVAKVCAYARLLWDDRDWDWAYILKLLKYKLERTRKTIQAGNHHVGADRDCRRIRTCEILLDRIIRDNYCEVEWARFFQKYPVDWSRINDHTPEQDEAFWRVANHETYQQNQDLEMFCRIFRKHVRDWWD
jgi:hypothetical protein